MSDGADPDSGFRSRFDERSDYHPLRWLLLSGDRRTVTLLLCALILLALLVLGTVWDIEMETLVNETRAVQSLFNTLLGGIILFVSVVLSINTAVLSQEFGPLWTKQARIEESIEFKADLEALAGTEVSSAELGAFFLFILDALRSEADRLRSQAEGMESADLRDALLDVVDDIEEGVRLVEGRLQSRNRRISSILLAGVDYDTASHLHTIRRLRSEHRDDLTDDEWETLTTLTEIMTALASGREYFTTLYYKREIRALSSSLLLLALPVIVFTSYVLLAIDAGQFPTLTAFGIPTRLLYVTIAFVVALSPYVLLSAYMLRLVTVSKYSLGLDGFTFVEEDAE